MHRLSFFAIRLVHVVMLVGGVLLGAVQAAPAPAGRSATVFVPVVQQPDPFAQVQAIWSHASLPAAHEVALFRHTFTLPAPLAEATIAIFADTRYELWLDGVQLGRGPARFSKLTHEYDTYTLGTLGAGSHTLAALVQWAPNVRRSESTRPSLQVRLAGAGGIAVLSGESWRALGSPAWRSDAALVHAWRLVGPTELLDLRALPPDWMQPGFDDRSWPVAMMVPISEAKVVARTLPALAQVSMPISLRDSGLLAPAMRIAELPATTRPASYALRVLANTTITIETLTTPGTPGPNALKLDNRALAWQPRPNRPDVVFATSTLAAGAHTFQATTGNGVGITIGVSMANLDTSALPFTQSNHAGRRLLLAAPLSQAGVVTATTGATLNLQFQQTPAYAVLDLGRTVYGRVAATVNGPASSIVDIGWDERLWQGTRPLPFPGTLHPEWNETDSWVLDGRARELTTIDARGGRYVLIAAWGPGPVQLANLRVLEERLPVQQRGSFSSADARLNQIWQVGVNTLYPNMSDAYSDPWREHGQWWGDAYVIDLANEVALGDSQLLARGLRQIAETAQGGRLRGLAPNGEGNNMLDYGMLWAQGLRNYLRRTGDTALPGQLYPTLTGFIQYSENYKNATTGLLDIPYGNWWETSLIDWAASADRYGQSTAVNALYYRTLLDSADVADALGDAGRAATWRARAAQIKTGLNTLLYVPTQGAYAATLVNGAARPPTPHAQAWALANDIVPTTEQQRVADSLVASLSTDPSAPNVEVYGMFWVLEGLGRAGRIADATTIVKRYYGYMLDHGATTWWELFNGYRSYTTSLSHGWGASPTWFLTRYVLGALRTGPHSWQLQPPMRAFTGAAGALPLAEGQLQASWATVSCGQYTLDLSAPNGSNGEVLLPFSDTTAMVTVNGAIVWQQGRANRSAITATPTGLRLALSGGQQHIDIRTSCK